MTVIERWECPQCGRERTEHDNARYCIGVLTVAQHELKPWMKAEYVPAEQLVGAVKALREVVRLGDQAPWRWNGVEVARSALADLGIVVPPPGGGR